MRLPRGDRARRLGCAGAAATAACAIVACGGSDAVPMGPGDGDGPTELRLVIVGEGFRAPVALESPPGDTRRFVVEQGGTIRILRSGRPVDPPFLDISGRVAAGGERGLLGIAFHPRWAENGSFYVNYTDVAGDTRVVRFRVGSDPGRADPNSASEVLAVEQPFSNHNGGQLLFGSDGMLYVALGDGGGAGDPLGNARDPGTLLGSLLRLDVDAAEPYAIPPDNPFARSDEGRGEVWHLGLRNPWRSAFDPAAGLLYVADVGQSRLEEVNVVPASEGGLDFGWNVVEGSECFPSSPCDASGFVTPALEYDHSEGCSVTGGRVYRGDALPDLRGHYFYSDFCAGWLRSFRWDGTAAVDRRQWADGLGSVLAFGEDAAGELYVLSADGRIRRLEPGP